MTDESLVTLVVIAPMAGVSATLCGVHLYLDHWSGVVCFGVIAILLAFGVAACAADLSRKLS